MFNLALPIWPLLFLSAALAFALLPNRWAAHSRLTVAPWGLGLCAILSGWGWGWMSVWALPPLGLLAGAVWGLRRAKTAWVRGVCGCAALVVSLALALHRWPGFASVLWWDAVHLSAQARPVTVAWSMDKPLAGLILWLGLWGGGVDGAHGTPRAALADDRTGVDRPTVCLAVGVALATLVGVLALGVLSGGVSWSPRWLAWPQGGGVFLLTNLLFTCVAEEAFFRGLVQEGLAGGWLRGMGHSVGMDLSRRAASGLACRPWVVWLLTAVVFGLAHAGGGALWMLWAGAAGLGYAAVYGLTQRLQASIALHFALNALHFLAFTYPARA